MNSADGAVRFLRRRRYKNPSRARRKRRRRPPKTPPTIAPTLVLWAARFEELDEDEDLNPVVAEATGNVW